MELVDDHDVELPAGSIGRSLPERLDGREDVLPLAWALRRRPSARRTSRRAGRGGRSPGSDAGCARGGRRRAASSRQLARGAGGSRGRPRSSCRCRSRRPPGCGDARALRSHLERSSICAGTGSGSMSNGVRIRCASVGARRRRGHGEAFGIEVLEIAGRPSSVSKVALERGDDIRVAALGGADVPLEPGDLGGKERLDEPMYTVETPVCATEQPRLGVQAGGAGVVGDLDLGAELAQRDRGPAARCCRCTWW